MTKITVTVSGISGSGKSTVATHIRNYLKIIGFDVSLELGCKEMAPCPTVLRKRSAGLIDMGIEIDIIEKYTANRTAFNALETLAGQEEK